MPSMETMGTSTTMGWVTNTTNSASVTTAGWVFTNYLTTTATTVANTITLPWDWTGRIEPLTPEQERAAADRAQRLAEEMAERRHRFDRDEAAWAAAERRAEVLLISLLDAAQKREWLAHQRVTVTSPSGRVYRLFRKWSGNLAIMDGEVRRATLCVHPKERVPDADNMVAQLLHIQHDEAHFLKTAILHQGAWSDDERRIRAA